MLFPFEYIPSFIILVYLTWANHHTHSRPYSWGDIHFLIYSLVDELSASEKLYHYAPLKPDTFVFFSVYYVYDCYEWYLRSGRRRISYRTRKGICIHHLRCLVGSLDMNFRFVFCFSFASLSNYDARSGISLFGRTKNEKKKERKRSASLTTSKTVKLRAVCVFQYLLWNFTYIFRTPPRAPWPFSEEWSVLRVHGIYDSVHYRHYCAQIRRLCV